MFLVNKGHIPVWLPGIVAVVLVAACSKTKEPTANFVFKKDCSGSTTCQVTFTNLSQNADGFKWDFGDGETSIETNPVHLYSRSKGYYVVTLKAINVSEAKEIFYQDTVYLVENPACENIGTFNCAKKLEPGITVQDNISADNNNYYYLVTPKPGVIKIQLSPIPSGSYMYVELLSEPRENSPVLKSEYGYPGESVLYYAGPVTRDTFYVKLRPVNMGADTYSLTYSFIYSDSNEVNNSFHLATPINFNVPLTGTMLSTSDVDYFSFHLSTPGTVDFTLQPVPDLGSGGYLTLQVFEHANSNSSLGYKIGYPGETIHLSEGPLEAGTHYILVKTNGRESTGQYKLTIAKDATDDNEINNSFSKATPIHGNGHLAASLKAAGDVDYYKYTAVSNGALTVDINRVPLGIRHMSVDIYSSANSLDKLESTGNSAGDAINFTTSKSLVQGKDYYIKISSYYSNDESNERYFLKINQ